MTTALLAGRYELQERLGRGAVGQVWRAHDTRLQRMVAIKTVDLNSKDDPAVEQRFQREAITTAGLSSPYVVRIYDAGSDGDTAYLVMELLDGRSIADLIREHGPVPLGEALRLGAQIADGLAAAHAAGVTHRDIKPANVMLHDNEAKIVDFGIARLAEFQHETLTSPAMVVGTASYMSPEQGLGEPVTAASDVYSLGCLLYTMLTGRPPFRAETAVALMRAHCDDVPPRLANQLPGISPALDELVACCLAKPPQNRPTSEQLAAELRRIAGDPTGHSQLPAVADATMLRPAYQPEPGGSPATPVAPQPSSLLHSTPTPVGPPMGVAAAVVGGPGSQCPGTATGPGRQVQGPAAGPVGVSSTATMTGIQALPPTGPERRAGRGVAAGLIAGGVVLALGATAVALFWWPGFLRQPDVVVVTPPPITVTAGHDFPTPTNGGETTGGSTEGPKNHAKEREAVGKAIEKIKDEDARGQLQDVWDATPDPLASRDELDPLRGSVAAVFALDWISQQEYDALSKAIDKLAETI